MKRFDLRKMISIGIIALITSFSAMAATTSTNLALNKPELTDTFNMTTFLNDNWDILDTAVGTKLNADGTFVNGDWGDISVSADTVTLDTGVVSDNEIDYTNVTLNDFTFDVGSVSKTEFGYLNNVTSAIQTQLDAKLESVAVSDLDTGTDGELITWDASGNPDTVAAGTADQVLTSNGAGAAPTFQDTVGGNHLQQTQQELTDGANISWNMDSGGYGYVTLGGNRTLDNPTNVQAGGLYRIRVSQDATGSRTLSYGANFEFPGGVEPVLSSGANDVDLLEFIAHDSSTLYLVNALYDIQ